MNTPMLPEPPECGTPCGACEALAHDNARLRAEVARLNESIQRHGNANDQLVVENTALRTEVAMLRELLSQSLEWVNDYAARLSGSARLADEIRAALAQEEKS